MQWASQAYMHDQTEAQQAAASAGGAHGWQQMRLWPTRALGRASLIVRSSFQNAECLYTFIRAIREAV